MEQAPVRQPGQLVGQRQLAARVQRAVLDERQRHPAEHGDERGGREPDRRVDGPVEVVGDEQPGGDEREQRRRDERAPAVERDLPRRALRAPRRGRRSRRPRRAPSTGMSHAGTVAPSPALTCTASHDRAQQHAERQQQPDRAHAPAAQRQRHDDHHHQQHVAHRERERDGGLEAHCRCRPGSGRPAAGSRSPRRRACRSARRAPARARSAAAAGGRTARAATNAAGKNASRKPSAADGNGMRAARGRRGSSLRPRWRPARRRARSTRRGPAGACRRARARPPLRPAQARPRRGHSLPSDRPARGGT